MPTYEYECTNCSHRFDAFQSMSDDALTECPECKGLVKRLIAGGAGIIFKGSGFYSTDSRASTAKKSEGSADSSTKDTSGSSGNGDSKSGDAKSGDSKGTESKSSESKGSDSSSSKESSGTGSEKKSKIS